MSKFTELVKGTFVKNGKEYDYIVEIAEDFPKEEAGNVRLKIIEERPTIRKIRTRYDPEITTYGDKDASMELVLGYDMKEVKRAFRMLLFTLTFPFYVLLVGLLVNNLDKVPKSFFSHLSFWIIVIIGCILTAVFFAFYYKMNMTMLAEYLKARDLKKLLKEQGFKQ